MDCSSKCSTAITAKPRTMVSTVWRWIRMRGDGIASVDPTTHWIDRISISPTLAGEMTAALARGWHTDVLCARSNQVIGGVLLDRVADPADGSADGEQHEWCPGRQPQHACDGSESKVHIWLLTNQRGCGGLELDDE